MSLEFSKYMNMMGLPVHEIVLSSLSSWSLCQMHMIVPLYTDHFLNQCILGGKKGV